MQELWVYEYAIIRIVPRPDREEFLNVGVILYCKRKKYLNVLLDWQTQRWGGAFPGIDIESISKNLKGLEGIAKGETSCGPIAKLDIDERFRWLTAVRSTMIQTSRPHPGLTTNPQQCIEHILSESVTWI